MKKLLTLLMVILLSGCFNPRDGKKNKNDASPNDFSDLELMFEAKNIHLISLKNKVDYDTAYNLIKGYKIKTDTIIFWNEIKKENISNMMDSLAKKNNLSLETTISLIYSFELLNN